MGGCGRARVLENSVPGRSYLDNNRPKGYLQQTRVGGGGEGVIFFFCLFFFLPLFWRCWLAGGFGLMALRDSISVQIGPSPR